MKTIRYTLLRRPWRLPLALPHDLARGSRDAKERPPDASPPPGGYPGPLAQPRNSLATKAARHLSAARP